MPPDQQSSPNLLIRILSPNILAAIQPGLERVDLARGQILSEPDKPVRHIHFPEGGVVSVVASVLDTAPTEVGMIGFEGMVGYTAALGAISSPFTTMVQVDGTTSLRMETTEFIARMAENADLRDLILKFAYSMQVQTAFNLLSQAHYHMESRLARWLLMCCDRSDSDDLHLTHEFMAVMLGAQRTSVTVTLHILEGLKAIRSTRGIVNISDRAKLTEIAGATYGPAEAEYRRLIGPFGASCGTNEPD